MAEFDNNQSAIQYGESLLASREKERKKQRKRKKRIDRVNMALAGVSIADSFLTKNARQKVDTFTQNLTAEKAREIHNLSLATQWKTDSVKPLMTISPSLNLDDPDAFKKNGSVFNALRAKEIKLRKTATGDYGSLDLTPEDNEYIDKAAELNRARLQREYNKYQGYLDTSKVLLDTKYSRLLERSTKDILSPQNTSSIRKLLSKFNIANKLEPDLIESKYEGIYIPSDDKEFESLITSRQKSFDEAKLSTDPEAVKQMEELNNYWTGRKEPPKPRKIKELSSYNKDILFDTILDKEKNYRIGEFLDEFKMNNTNLPRLEENLTYTKVFKELSSYDKRNFVTDITTDLETLVASKSTREQDYKFTTQEVAALTFRRASQILKTAEKTEGFIDAFDSTITTYNYPPKDSQFLQTQLKTEETDTSEVDDTKGDTSSRTSVVPFNFKLEIFRKSLQSESKEEINNQFKTLIQEHPEQTLQIIDLYDTYKNKSEDTPIPSVTNTDLSTMSEQQLEEYAEKGGEGGFDELKTFFADQQNQKNRETLQRYVDTGKKSTFFTSTLKRVGLPKNATVLQIQKYLENEDISSLLAKT